MDYTAIVAAVTVFPILVGYLRGRKNIDPNTPAGKGYYNEEV